MFKHRGRLFVHPAFQGRLMFRMTAYWAVYHVVLFHLLFLFGLFSQLISASVDAPSVTMLQRYRSFALDHVSIPVCFLVTLPLFLRYTLRFSHRLVGPFIRFRDVMTEMVQGKRVPEITLRRSDLPGDFLDAFNALIKQWNERRPDAPESHADQLELAGTR
jgi:hypothetical protein